MIVVTGATGFVGRRLMRVLIANYTSEEILCLVHEQAENELESSGRAVLNELGVRYIPVELVSGKGLEHVPNSPRLVFHLASNTDTGAADHSVNDVGTRRLVESLQLGRGSHFIFTSTIAVSDHRVDMKTPVDENTPFLPPFNNYGRRKLATEAYLRKCAQERGFQITIVRLCAVYGRGTRQNGLFDRISRLVRNGSILSRLDYPGRLSLINVDDIANILFRLSQAEQCPGVRELYIPVGEVMTIAELIRCYYDAYGNPYQPIHLPRLFWLLCDHVARILYRLEPILPHVVNNRIWQLGLLVGNEFWNQSTKTQDRLAGLHLHRFRDTAREMIN